jgi:hypothetical protein
MLLVAGLEPPVTMFVTALTTEEIENPMTQLLYVLLTLCVNSLSGP